jgi:hypothetical protein
MSFEILEIIGKATDANGTIVPYTDYEHSTNNGIERLVSIREIIKVKFKVGDCIIKQAFYRTSWDILLGTDQELRDWTAYNVWIPFDGILYETSAGLFTTIPLHGSLGGWNLQSQNGCCVNNRISNTEDLPQEIQDTFNVSEASQELSFNQQVQVNRYYFRYQLELSIKNNTEKFVKIADHIGKSDYTSVLANTSLLNIDNSEHIKKIAIPCNLYVTYILTPDISLEPYQGISNAIDNINLNIIQSKNNQANINWRFNLPNHTTQLSLLEQGGERGDNARTINEFIGDYISFNYLSSPVYTYLRGRYGPFNLQDLYIEDDRDNYFGATACMVHPRSNIGQSLTRLSRLLYNELSSFFRRKKINQKNIDKSKRNISDDEDFI